MEASSGMAASGSGAVPSFEILRRINSSTFLVSAPIGGSHVGSQNVVHVIKILCKESLADDDANSLRSEIHSLWVTNHHRNVIRAWDATYLQSHPIFRGSAPAMHVSIEYMDLGSVADVNARLGIWPTQALTHILWSVLKGIMYLHLERHIAHRGLHQGNILLNSSGEVKISDFVSAAVLERTLGQKDSYVGKECYMAPERLSAPSHGISSDIWSLGIVAYMCSAGSFPFAVNQEADSVRSDGSLELATINRIVLSPPNPMPAGTDEDLMAFVESCLIKDPATRPSAQDLLEHNLFKQFPPNAEAMLAFVNS